jgi:signal transduction histidine kinase
MYTRLIILTVIVLTAVCGLGGLGFHAIDKWAQGLEGARLGEFAEVAEQVRRDVKRKLDEFILAEQQRKYTDYLYSYVPENVVDAAQLPLLRSPLGDQVSNYLAYGYFQIGPDGSIATPYYPSAPPGADERDEMAELVRSHVSNVRENVWTSIHWQAGILQVPSPEPDRVEEDKAAPSSPLAKESPAAQIQAGRKGLADAETRAGRSQAFPIESLQQEARETQVFQQQRSIAFSNQAQIAQKPPEMIVRSQVSSSRDERNEAPSASIGPPETLSAPAPDTVQVRVEPFVPLLVPDPEGRASVFGGQVFLLRHVQIESRHLLQGFQLDEHRLIAEVEDSARTLVREGMGFELPQVRRVNGRAGEPDEQPAYTAILDFGFGDLVLHLTELDPTWIARQIGEFHRIYFGIIATLLAAVGLALVSLWHNMRAQAALARKKDDFISAVSHELRTPLTSIRMYTEMLEKNWVKSKDKVGEYYRTMRQESERLSRLVENVLDFARLQKGRKNYAFALGSIDDCVAGVVELMRPCAEQHGFAIRTDLAAPGETCFDRDAVAQIVVNLLDNAVKYARAAADKTIAVRTRNEAGFTVIEIEDRGPGIPPRQRKRVFEQFYRCEDDGPAAQPGAAGATAHADAGSTTTRNRPQTTGMGLGLTLVQRFAEAHGGSVEIRAAEPKGTILRVSLITRQPVTG